MDNKGNGVGVTFADGGASSPKSSATGIDAEPGRLRRSAWGYLGRDDTESGRLVRMADVVLWLESAHDITRRHAVTKLCAKMEPSVMASLYWLNVDGDYAMSVEPDCMFGLPSRADAQRRLDENNEHAWQRAYNACEARGKHGGASKAEAIEHGLSDSLDPASFSDPGVPALTRRMLADWSNLTLPAPPGRPSWRKLSARGGGSPALDVDSLDDGRSPLARLAILMSAARELFGYGVATMQHESPVIEAANRRAAEIVQAPPNLPAVQPPMEASAIVWPVFPIGGVKISDDDSCIRLYRLHSSLEKSFTSTPTKAIMREYGLVDGKIVSGWSDGQIRKCVAKGRSLDKAFPSKSKARKSAAPPSWFPEVVHNRK